MPLRTNRFVLAGPSGFTRLSLVFLLRECGARMRRIFPVSPFFSCSNGAGEREIGAGTVTTPFSHLEYGQMRYFEPPLLSYRTPHGKAETTAAAAVIVWNYDGRRRNAANTF